MHPAALSPLKDLFHPATTLSDLCGGCVDEAYVPSVPAGSMDYTWAQYESAHGTDKATGHRIGGFCSRFAADNPDITFVVCTHGGPSAACYEHLTGLALVSSVCCFERMCMLALATALAHCPRCLACKTHSLIHQFGNRPAVRRSRLPASCWVHRHPCTGS
jgi:hypothetical protein